MNKNIKNTTEELERRIEKATGGKVVIRSVENEINKKHEIFDIRVLREKAEKAAELLAEVCND